MPCYRGLQSMLAGRRWRKGKILPPAPVPIPPTVATMLVRHSGLHEQDARQRGDTLAAARKTEMLGGRRLDVDLLDSSPAVGSDVRDHLRDVRSESRRLRDHCRIEIPQGIAGRARILPDAAQ